MNDRAEAIQILKQARDLLAERLTREILHAREEILDDARGESYMGEIDALYEQLGGRLLHVSQMLANLPAAAEAVPQPEKADTFQADVHVGIAAGDVGALDAETEEPEQASRSVSTPSALALPAPGSVGGGAGAISFRSFADEAQQGNVAAAGRMLAELFEVDEARGLRCAEVFCDRLRADSRFLLKAMELRHELHQGSYNGAMMLLYECFGLTGMESLAVMHTLRTRFLTGS